MKLICLNIWGGKVYGPLMKYVREQAGTTDIFCFQEVFRSPRKDIETTENTRIRILDELAAALPDFNYIFHPVVSGVDNSGPVDFDIEMGQAEFVRKSIPVVSSGEVGIYSPKDSTERGGYEFSPRNFGYFRANSENNAFTVINVHGLTFHGDDKLDTPERLEQSRKIKEFALNEKNPVIVCGDFNLLPNTQSIAMLEDSFANMIKRFGIANTRSRLHPWYGDPTDYKFSDYVFVSPDVKVSGFGVPDVEISDHLPLVLEFSQEFGILTPARSANGSDTKSESGV